MSTSTRAKVDAFEAWLRAAGTPDEIASFSRSIAEGFVAVAGTRPVSAEHVEMSVRFARDAKLDVTAMQRLGAVLVRWSEAGEPAPPAPPARASEAAPVAGSLAAAIAAAPAAGSLAAAIAAAPVKSEPAKSEPVTSEPVKSEPEAPRAEPAIDEPRVSFRASQAMPPLEKPAAAAPAPAADEPAVISDTPPPKRAATAPLPRAPTSTGRKPPVAAARAKLVAAIAVVASAGVIAWHLHVARPAFDDDVPATAAAGTDGVHRLAPLNLTADFPAGWHVTPVPAAAAALGAAKTALVARGGTDADPDDRAFVATLPLTDSLAPGLDITDDALVHAAQAAERGTSARIGAGGATYATGGCSVTAAAAHTAVCRGTIRAGNTTLALQTYLRIGEERAVVALFVSKLSVRDPQAEADQIVASFAL